MVSRGVLRVIISVSLLACAVEVNAGGPPSGANRPKPGSSSGSGTKPASSSPSPADSATSGKGDEGLGKLIGDAEVAFVGTEKENPGVMIGNQVYHVNDQVGGGKIVDISAGQVTIKFKDKEKSFGVGDSVE